MTEAPPRLQPDLDFVDANVVVRYLIRDIPDLTARATALIEGERLLRISVVILSEVGHVLTRLYNISRADAVDAMIDLLERQNIEVHEVPTEVAIEALRLCRPGRRVSFGDAMLWAVARTAAPSRVWTFDARFLVHGIQVQEP